MPTYRAPLNDFRFLLNEWLRLGDHTNVPGFTEAAELAAPLLEEGAKLCENVLFPLNQSGDAEGCRWENGNVYMPKGFKEAYAQYVAGGWPSFTCDPDFGGQGLPEVLNMPVTEMICSANLSFGLTPGLSHSAYNLMAKYCPEALKPRFMPKLISGEWSGVMCLTEPQCGTDLGLIRTKATPNDDGTYAIEGTKIFISSGEQDLTENILHLVLAKLPDAPKGVKGISLFLVPKVWVNEDGSLGERGAVTCASIEHKMGIHGSSTCVMNYDGAKGYLIGEPHRGLPAMFTMMNAARIYVGVQGLGVAEAAYQGALAYANERLQGRAMKGPKHPEKPADPITVHPDVRRMLLTIRAFCEGGRALVLLTAMKHDLAHRHPDAAVREEADDFVQLMTPIVKAYLTDMGTESANLAMQCLGGYGYIREYGIEQYARDARIAQIYEGTNGIQALDLVGRKLSHKYGKYLRGFFHPVQQFIDDHAADPQMQEFIKPLEKHVGYLRQASLWIAQKGLANPDDAAAASVEYLRLFALVVMAWIWAQQAKIALQRLGATPLPSSPRMQGEGFSSRGDGHLPPPQAGEGWGGGALADTPGESPEFYREKLATARFFYARILPQTISLLACLTAGSKPLMEANLETV